MSFADSRRAGVCLLALLLSHSFVCHAAMAGDLTLREVVALTNERSPQLRAFAFESEVVRQQSAARAASPPVALEGQFEDFAGTGAASGTRALETTLQLSKVFELGGKAELRGALGDAELSGLEARQRALRADLIAEAARRFLHVLADQAQLEVTRRATELARQARDAVEARIREGAISSIFLNRAEIALARARIAQEHAEHELAASRIHLSIMWGDTEASFDRLNGDLFRFPGIESLESYVVRLGENPDLLKLASEERIIEGRRRLAKSQRVPNLTLSAGVRHLESIDAQAFVAGFSLPLGVRSRADLEKRAVQAESERLRLDAATRRLELRSLLFGLYQEILHARTEANVFHGDIRQQAQQMVETTAEGYRQGRYSLVELIDAQQALTEVEQGAIRAALEFHTNLIEIERATGLAVHTFVGG